MSGAMTLGTEQAVLGHTLGFAAMPPAGQVWIALCAAEPSPSEAIAGTEVSGLGYSRVAATFGLLSSPSNAAANAAAVAFPAAGNGWGQVGWFEVWDAQRGGRRLYWGQLTDPSGDGVPVALTVAAGDVLRFSPGALVIQITNATAITGGPYLLTAGGIMTGDLTLAGDPTTPLMAATRQYVDGHLPAGWPFVSINGSTMTGPLILNADPSSPLGAATRQYVDNAVPAGGPFLPLVGGVVSGPTSFGGAINPGSMLTVRQGGLYQTGATQPDHASDVQYSSFTNLCVYTADASSGANLGLVSTLQIDAGGFHYVPTHSAGVLGVLNSVGAGTVDFISGVSGSSGNAGIGTVTNVAAFRAHNTYNTGGGTIVNDWAFWHDPAPVGTATNQFGFYVARPSGMGVVPLFNLDIQCYSAGMNPTQGLRINFVSGQSNFTVTNTGLGLGTAAATAQVDVRGIDSLGTTRLLRLRNPSADVFVVNANGSIGFNGAGAITKPTVSGSRAANAALASLITALANYGLVTDGSTA